MNIFKKIFKKTTSTDSISTTLTITSSNGFHLRPIAQFVNEAKKFDATITLHAHNQEVSATQVPKILALALDKGESFTLKCRGEEAEKASSHLSSFFIKLMQDDKKQEEIPQKRIEKEERYQGERLQGITISKGIGIGVMVNYFKEQSYQANALSLEEALLKTKEDLEKLYETNREKEEAEIFLAHKALLESDIFQKNFENIEQEIEKLKGGKFSSRMADYRDIKNRIDSYMGTTSTFTLPNGDEDPCIVVADEELLPSEVEELSRLNVVGVILKQGSPTSHVAILLRSFNIPSIISHETITITGEYFYSILDATLGKIVLVPFEEDFTKAKERAKKEKEESKQSHSKRFEEVKTSKGDVIKILANITDLNSAKEAKELGADGIGLLRTEFLFTEKKPTIEEQTQAYSDIFELFDEVTVRTLDIGGDKSLPYIEIPKEDNPFLGIRGIRFSLQEQTLFKEQLLAIGLAVGSVTPNKTKTIKIMFPMVSNTEEFKQAKAIALKIYQENNIKTDNIQFGIMLEVPSVIFALKEFDQIVDFYSIGTNDLTQYLFAIERTHPTLQADVSSPLLMNALKQIVETTTKPISICGELAGLEEMTIELIGMGYRSLSVSTKLIPLIKERVRNS